MKTTQRLLLAGAGHAHLGLIHSISRLLARNVSVTVVDPNEALWYSGMMPAVLRARVDPSAARIAVREIVERQGGEYVVEALEEIHPADRVARTTSGRTIPWDVLSVAVGSTVVPPFPVATSGAVAVFGAKPIARLPEIVGHIRELGAARAARGDNRPVSVVFVGGGPSAVELAGNLATRVANDRADAARHVRIGIATRADRLLPRMPDRAGRVALRSLTARRVAVRLDTPIRAVSESGIQLDDGTLEEWDLVVLTTGLRAPDLFSRSGLPTDRDGALRVDRTLRMAGAPIFGGGDCIAIDGLPLARAGVHAVRQQGVLVHNIAVELGVDPAELTGPPVPTNDRAGQPVPTDEPPDPPEPRAEPPVGGQDAAAQTQPRGQHPGTERSEPAPAGLITYTPPPSPLLILNLGDGTAVSVRGRRVHHGRLPALLKERIDWGFVASEGRRILPAWRPPPRPTQPPAPPETPGPTKPPAPTAYPHDGAGPRSERNDND